MTAERVREGQRGLLARLRRDTAGNTLAIMAAALLPLCAFAGSAVDMARLYVVKVRLQQACDAGALAGRKSMASRGVSTLDDTATTQAKTFFANNFSSGYMSTPAFSMASATAQNPYPFTPTLGTQGQVNGTATIMVPMALMSMFGAATQPITVSCQARFDVADGDVVFVLDVTGSMACLTSDSQSTCDSYASSPANLNLNSDGTYSVTEKQGSRIAGLRTAVQNFYTTVDSYRQSNPSMNFRYGFVPYNATVNVGQVLPRSYMAPSTWTYQSRTYSGYQNNGSATSTTTNSISKAACTAKAGQSGWTTNVATGTSSGTTGSYTSTITTVGSWTQSGQSGNVGTCVTSSQPVMAIFQYAQRSLDVSSFAALGTAVANPTMLDGSTSKWNGCIEERGGTSTATSFDPNNPPLDLDVDTAPSASVPNSYWGPMWPDAEYARANLSSSPETSTDYRDRLTRYQYSTYFGTYQVAHLFNEVPCPKSAQRLTTMALADVQAYLSASNGFRPYGVTYHDVGMTWGTRLLSPTGMFASDTAAWPNHNAPNRYIIFLTDGTMETDEYAYTSHGIEQYDNRVGSGGNATTLTNIHNARFAAACTIAKNRNIKVFVISYAQTLTTQLSNCASPNQAYYAADSTSLNAAFTQIASQVAMLRLSQ